MYTFPTNKLPLPACLPHLNGSQVMCANSHQCPLPAQVLVQLVLQVNEAVVAGWVKGHTTQHSSHHKGPNKGGLRLDHNTLQGLACEQIQECT